MSANAAVAAVLELHKPPHTTESVIDWDCIYGDCEHDGDCEETTITPCQECSAPGPESEIYVAYPCATVRAINRHIKEQAQ